MGKTRNKTRKMKIFSKSAACALIAVANVTAAANASASAKSSASATSSATANAFGYGFNAPTVYRPTTYTRPMPPTNYQSLKPCTTAYNELMKFNTEWSAAADLPECSADGYYKAVQCDQNDCWCSTREGKEKFGSFGTTYQPGQITDTWIVGNPTIQHGFMQTGTQYFPANSVTAKADATATSTGGGRAWSDASSTAEVIPSN